MPVDDESGSVVVQQAPDRLHMGIVPVFPRTEHGMVPVGHRALGAADREVGLKPLVLRRSGAGRHVAIERHDVPGPDIVAVVPKTRETCDRAEVGIVGEGRRRVVLVIARRGARARLVASPRQIVAVTVLLRGAVFVRVVAGREDHSVDRIQQSHRLLRPRVATRCDVAGADQHPADRAPRQ